ncbi:MAG: class IV adenylate cyclase [Rickettsiales bacterium]|jgi:adenylate cyclase class 2|nr:class IV adenylate cyclase [Rickettsiales bacterium]
MKPEIELKFYPIDKDEVRQKLSAAGFDLTEPEFMMTRTVFHSRHLPDSWGRVRREKTSTTLSIKKNTGYGLTKTQEIELRVDSPDNAAAFMEAAGFHKASYQESLREIWRKGDVEADIDQWPGLFPWVEIEGPTEESVRKACADIGFDEADAMYGSADFVYERELGIPRHEINARPEITFKNPPVRAA